ncbi:MAG: hypothetical protein V1928_03945 [Parcubacteria group bacterium]
MNKTNGDYYIVLESQIGKIKNCRTPKAFKNESDFNTWYRLFGSKLNQKVIAKNLTMEKARELCRVNQ